MSNTALNTIVDNAKQARELGVAKLNPYLEQSNEYVAYELGWEGYVTLEKRFDGQEFGIERDCDEFQSVVPSDLADAGEGYIHATLEDTLEYLHTLYWTKKDSETAQLQGWGIFEASLTEKPAMRIGHTMMEVFADDDAALAFVQERAAAGDPLAIKALKLDAELRQRGESAESGQFFNAGNQSTIGDLMMADILGGEAEGEGPEWTWVQRHASFSHIRNGEDGIWEFLLNMSRSFEVESIPEKLLPVITEARAKGLSYVLIHNGT